MSINFKVTQPTKWRETEAVLLRKINNYQLHSSPFFLHSKIDFMSVLFFYCAVNINVVYRWISFKIKYKRNAVERKYMAIEFDTCRTRGNYAQRFIHVFGMCVFTEDPPFSHAIRMSSDLFTVFDCGPIYGAIVYRAPIFHDLLALVTR